MGYRAVRAAAILALCLFLGGAKGCPLQTFDTWKQGQPPVSLASERDAFCYLTRISGAFQGEAEAVTLTLEGDPGERTWVLGGRSGANDVTAEASCVAWKAFDRARLPLFIGAKVTTTFENSVEEVRCGCNEGGCGPCPLRPCPVCEVCEVIPPSTVRTCSYPPCPGCDPNRRTGTGTRFVWTTTIYPGYGVLRNEPEFCYLREVGGNLNGDQESVAVLGSLHPQQIEVRSATIEGGRLLGAAACAGLVFPVTDRVDVSSVGGPDEPLKTRRRVTEEYSWSQGQVPIPMILASEGVCFLTRISGRFRGDGEAIAITRIAEQGDERMLLGGASGQEGVSGAARCVYFNVR